MRIGIVTIGNNPQLLQFSKDVHRKLVEKGHSIKVYNKNTDINERFTINKHLIFFVDAGTFFQKSALPELKNFLKVRGDLNVKYGSLIINKKPFPDKIFVKTMATLEENGLILQYTNIIKNTKEMNDLISTMHFEEK